MNSSCVWLSCAFLRAQFEFLACRFEADFGENIVDFLRCESIQPIVADRGEGLPDRSVHVYTQEWHIDQPSAAPGGRRGKFT